MVENGTVYFSFLSFSFSERIRFMLRNKLEILGHWSQKHFTQFHPIDTVPRCHQCFKIVAADETVRTFINSLWRTLQYTVGYIPIHERLPFQQKSVNLNLSISTNKMDRMFKLLPSRRFDPLRIASPVFEAIVNVFLHNIETFTTRYIE